MIPFIFMTGKPDHRDIETAENLPINDFIQKPISKNKLIQLIKRVLKKAEHDYAVLGSRFDETITDMLSPSLLERIGDYTIDLKWQSITPGGGDMAFHVKGDQCDHIIVIDIMGHGEKAKFFSHNIAGYLQGFLSAQKSVHSPSLILEALSKHMYHNVIGSKIFLTAQVLTLLQNGSLLIANAGHPVPMITKYNQIFEYELTGSVPGLFADTLYQDKTIDLKKSESLYLYTDGLFEIGENAEQMEKSKNAILDSIAQSKNIDEIWDYFQKHDVKDDALLIQIQRV